MPARSECIMTVRVNAKEETVGVVDPRPELCQCWHVTAARSVSKVRNGRATIKRLNPTDKDIDITTGVCLGFFEEVQEIRQTQDETDGEKKGYRTKQK